jgi:hypothetical protein
VTLEVYLYSYSVSTPQILLVVDAVTRYRYTAKEEGLMRGAWEEFKRGWREAGEDWRRRWPWVFGLALVISAVITALQMTGRLR